MATLHDTLIGRRSFYSHKYTDGTGYKVPPTLLMLSSAPLRVTVCCWVFQLPKSGRSEFNKRWRQRVVTQQDESFRKLYDRFVQEVVVPSLGVECVYYQHLPTFRVAPPGMRYESCVLRTKTHLPQTDSGVRVGRVNARGVSRVR